MMCRHQRCYYKLLKYVDIGLLSIWMSDASISNCTVNSRIGTPLIHLCFIVPIILPLDG
jgi:hypothetical protein